MYRILFSLLYFELVSKINDSKKITLLRWIFGQNSKWIKCVSLQKELSCFPIPINFLNSVSTRPNNILQERQFVLLFIAQKVLDISQEIPVLGGFQQTQRAECFRLKGRLESECGQYSKSNVPDFWDSVFIREGSYGKTLMNKIWRKKELAYQYTILITGIMKLKFTTFT